MGEPNDGMVWKNPCPDASVPMCPSGAFGVFTVGGGAFNQGFAGANPSLPVPNGFGGGGLISGPPLHELTGAQRPSISYTLHTTNPRWDAKPTVAPDYIATPEVHIDPILDNLRDVYVTMKNTHVGSTLKIKEQAEEIAKLQIQVEWYKKIVSDQESKFAKIKAHL